MKNSGMTLLEVLVALTVFALASLALLQSVNQQTRHLAALEEKLFSGWVAENQLVELKLARIWPAERWSQGQSDMAGRRWYWRWHGIPTADPRLRALEIEVSLEPPRSTAEWPALRNSLRSYVVQP